MSRCFLYLMLVLTFALPVQAGHAQGKAQPPEDSADAALAQKRRDALRETLKAPVNDADATKRRLSPQQRAELREQLRQQDPDQPK